ncbi:MAG: hypothetical protein ABI425_04745 [Patescibacteria group bacterium]
MFWKRTVLSPSVESWQMLQWWRTPQEYIVWSTIDPKEPFGKHFQETENNVVVEFDDEVSVLTTVLELKTVLEELWKKAESSLISDAKDLQSKLLLKSTQLASKKFLVKPFFRESTLLSFWPPKEATGNVFLTLAFWHPSQSALEVDGRVRQWTDLLQTDQINTFVFRQSVQLFQVLLQDQIKKKPFDALIDVLTHFETVIMDVDYQVSQEYLKKVWRVPLFIFANQPEQAAFTRLILQKSFQKQLPEIRSACTSLYEALQLKT